MGSALGYPLCAWLPTAPNHSCNVVGMARGCYQTQPPAPQLTHPQRTCAQTIVMASHCVGLTLPGMMEEPGSFSGSCGGEGLGA